MQGIFDVLFQPERMYKSPLELWRDPKWVDIRRRGVVEHTHLPRIDHWWVRPEPFQAISNSMMMTYYIDPKNIISGRGKPLVIDGYDILSVWGTNSQLRPRTDDRYAEIMANYRRIVEGVQPPYALIDHYDDGVKKRRGQDLRRYAWGAMLYGPEMVEAVGRDRIKASAGLIIKEGRPDGGMWLQPWANPFVLATEHRQQVEKEIGLKDADLPEQETHGASLGARR